MTTGAGVAAMTAEELAGIEGLLAGASLKWMPDYIMRTRGGKAVAAVLESAPALIALARRALELESALNYLHKESPMSTSDFEPHAILMLAKQLGWSPTAKGEANGNG